MPYIFNVAFYVIKLFLSVIEMHDYDANHMIDMTSKVEVKLLDARCKC
jgi:hypothetical protein